MRVTDSSVFDSVKRQVLKAREGVLTAQQQAGTGLRVQKPSDDPVAAASARRETSRKALADAGVAATDAATTQLEGTDSALNDVFSQLTSARDLALENASSTASAENRTAAASQVRMIRDQMVALGNTNVGGHYVFAGYRDQSPAFAANGDFVGDTSTKEVQAMPGLHVKASISGDKVFGSDAPDSMFSALDKLASALDANDPDAVRDTLKDLDTNQSRVLAARSQVGGMLDGAQVAGAVASQNSYQAKLQVGRLVEVDEVTAATNLVQAQNALNSALAIAQQIPTGGLVGGK
jgi:flagellar hook-associated protein 3 FlgL